MAESHGDVLRTYVFCDSLPSVASPILIQSSAYRTKGAAIDDRVCQVTMVYWKTPRQPYF